MKGMRAAELCAGQFKEVLAQMIEASSARILLALQQDLSAPERASILQDFHAGVSHIAFYDTLKLSHLSESP